MSVEKAEMAFNHAARQDLVDAVPVMLEGLAELIDEVRSLRAQLAELKASSR